MVKELSLKAVKQIYIAGQYPSRSVNIGIAGA